MTARIQRDLVACVVFLVAFFAIEWRFAFLNRFIDTDNYFGRVDEAVLALAATTTVALVFAMRRLADLRNDVVRQAASEQALIQAEARASLLFDKAPQAMWVFDEETGRFLAANDAAARRYGYSHEQFLQLTVYDIRPPEDRALMERVLGEVRGRPSTPARTYRHQTRSGEVIDVDIVSHAITFDGRAARFVVAVDVTERERATRALRDSDARLQESEARFRQLAESIESVFYLIDTATRTVLYVSPGYERIWEQSGESLQADSASFLRRVHPGDVEIARRQYDTLEQGDDVEYRLLMPDGRVKWVRDHTFPVRDAVGRVYRKAGIATEVTAQKRLEADLTQAQRMESVGRLAGGVAHDFNNLLTVIFSQAAMLEASVTDSGALEEVRQIQHAAERAATLTRQLLAFARRQVYEPRVVDLNLLVASTERLLGRLIGENIELVTRPSPGPATVRADPGSLEQVLMNLAVNARDAMPKGGRVTIGIDEVVLDASDPDRPAEAMAGPHVVLTVTDTGAGIPSEHLPHIFEPFYTTKPQGQGTGLGLATVYGIVRQAGGHIRLSSTVDRGTEVAIYLARVSEALVASLDEGGSRPAGGGETVLLVEDEVSVRNVAARVLTLAGYQVLQASDGADALDVYDTAAERIALVITDVVMPRIGGPELAARLRAKRPGLKVLFTSGYTEDTLVLQDLDPAQAFLQKPYMPAALSARVRALLDVPS
jgi:two-component system cell cycle sensor histidine kinase/response regulator CckA